MDLKAERESLVQQRDNAFAVYQQTIGAIALIDHLLAEEKEKEITLERLKESLGAQSAEIVEA